MAVAQNPGVPNDIDESALVLLVVAMNKVPLHKTGVEGAITVVIVTLEAGVPMRLRCLMWTETSCLIHLGQKCGLAQVLSLP